MPYHGYYFRAMEFDDSGPDPVDYRSDTDESGRKVHHPSQFGFCAYPAEYGRTGTWTFIINEGNTLFRTDSNGRPVLRWPEYEEPAPPPRRDD